MVLIRNILIPVSKNIDLRQVLNKKFGISGEFRILRRSIDARKRNHLKYNFTILTDIPPKLQKHHDILEYSKPVPYITKRIKLSNKHPFIIGAGPAGLFAAISLVKKGFQPYIFERGETIGKRKVKVRSFLETGVLNEESNIQFGEGGAGTFSDGKLTSRNHDFYTEKILDNLIKFGADERIRWNALSHLGTDGLTKIIVNMRKYLESKGCEFFWDHKLEDIRIEDGNVLEVTINRQTYSPEILILAIGNSARDTYELLSGKVNLENKPFAVGFRIEHPQDYINSAFYGDKTDINITGPATYKLTAKYKDRGIYSFCMCPGGYIVAAASEKNHQVLNGMSFQKRDNIYANSGIVVTVNEKDYGNGNLAGMELQRNIEQKCYASDKPYYAPIQRAADFLENKSILQKISNSYKPGTFPADLNGLLPTRISESIKSGLFSFDKRIAGFIENGVLLAPETRTSSPIRILRDKVTLQALEISNLFPIGEGSGYAGGIISSAADGYKLGCVF